MDWQLRSHMLLGGDAVLRLGVSHVAVVGIGGVGGFAAEALARSGVGRLTLVDHDTVGVTNINRQIAALHSTVGQSKAGVMAARVRDISPDCEVVPLTIRYNADTREEFFAQGVYDYIVDAIDLVSCKLDLIEQSILRHIPIISALGTGNKMEPGLLRVGDISKTMGCPLAKVMRKELRNRGIKHHTVVWSPEEGVTPLPLEQPPEGRRSVPSSMVFVPACAGLLLACHVADAIAASERTKQLTDTHI